MLATSTPEDPRTSTAVTSTTATLSPSIAPTLIPSEPTSTITASCTSVPWADRYGAGCELYLSNGWCNASGVGSSWRSNWGSLEDYAVDGVSASAACCGCGGGLHTATTMPSENMTLASTTATALSPWDCIRRDCVQTPADPVCADGIQYMNDCWARCFGKDDTESCDSRLENAISFDNISWPGGDGLINGSDITDFIANMNTSLCCSPEVARFQSENSLPSLWLSDAACTVDHTVRVPCGRSKSGLVTRVCTAQGEWMPENAIDCSDAGIQELSSVMDAVTASNAWQILAMLNSLIAADVFSIGKADLTATMHILHEILSARPMFNVMAGAMVVEIVGNVMDVNSDIMQAALADADHQTRFEPLVETFVAAYARSVSRQFQLQSGNGNLVIKSNQYPTHRGDADLVMSLGGDAVSMSVPLHPFRGLGLAGARVHLIFYNNSHLFPSALSAVDNPGQTMSALFENWPNGKSYDADITFRLPKPDASWNAACGSWGSVLEWHSSGCHRNMSFQGHSTMECVCSSMAGGHFGVLPNTDVILEPDGTDRSPSLANASRDTFLPIGAQIMMGMSIVLLALVITSFFCFNDLRRSHRRFYVVNLSFAVALSHTVLLFGWYGTPDACGTWSTILQYFVIATFVWIAINMRDCYCSSKMDHLRQSFWLNAVYMGCCWGLPLLLAVTTSALFPDGHLNGTDSTQICWAYRSTFWAGWAVPIILLTIVCVGYMVATGPKFLLSRSSFPTSSFVIPMMPFGGLSTFMLLLATVLTWTLRTWHARHQGSPTAALLVALGALLQSMIIFVKHFRFSNDGRQVVLQLTAGKAKFDENGAFWIASPSKLEPQPPIQAVGRGSPGWDHYQTMPRSGSPVKNGDENELRSPSLTARRSRASSHSSTASSLTSINFGKFNVDTGHGTHDMSEEQRFEAAAEIALDVSLHYDAPGFEMVHVGTPVTPSPFKSTRRNFHGSLDDAANGDERTRTASVASVPSVTFEPTMDVLTESTLPRAARTCPDAFEPYSPRTSTRRGNEPTMMRHTSGSYI